MLLMLMQLLGSPTSLAVLLLSFFQGQSLPLLGYYLLELAIWSLT